MECVGDALHDWSRGGWAGANVQAIAAAGDAREGAGDIRVEEDAALQCGAERAADWLNEARLQVDQCRLAVFMAADAPQGECAVERGARWPDQFLARAEGIGPDTTLCASWVDAEEVFGQSRR